MAICVEMTCLYAPAGGSALILSLSLCSIPCVADIGTLFPQAALRILCCLAVDKGFTGLLDHVLTHPQRLFPPGLLHGVSDVIKAKAKILELIETEIVDLVNLWGNSVGGLSQGKKAD